MFSFIWRRLIVGFFILLGATALSFLLVLLSGDPLSDLAELPPSEKAAKIAQRTEAMHLDEPPLTRYGIWLKEVGQCVASPISGDSVECTLGADRASRMVAPQLEAALGQTLRLVIVATVLALLLGVTVGIVTALRQYSVFDYLTTFVAFLCFSMPSFWIATLLKRYVAIDLNKWLNEPIMEYSTIAGVSLGAGLLWALVIGTKQGTKKKTTFKGVGFVGFIQAIGLAIWRYVSSLSARRFWFIVLVSGLATGGTLYLLLSTGWFNEPSVGIVGIIIGAFGAAALWSSLVGGFSKRKVKILYSGLITAVLGVVAYFAIQPILENANWLIIIVLAISAIAIGLGVGYLIGGFNRAAAMRVGALTAITTGLFIFIDRSLQAYPELFSFTNGRPMATTSAATPNLEGDFWLTNLDQITHLLLPTLALMLISFASYSRYTRAATLDTLGQDFVRTARSKGLAERTIVVRHVLRNALIPITTIVALDFAAVLGGAMVTETVFGWSGMGKLLQTSITNVDPNPMMAVMLVTATAAVVMNMLADIAYAFLDPRIRLS